MKKTAKILLSAVLSMAMLFGCCVAVSAETAGPTIKTQPQSVTVNYPDGAEFKVVPDNPDEVASYQWYYVDYVGQMFKLDGTSATTDTLICPSTDKYYDSNYFFCVLTGKNGGVTESNPAYVTVSNYDDDIKMLWVNNHTLKRGETLNLSKAHLGKGKITYAKDGKSITLDNVYMDNTVLPLDHTISNSLGITLWDNKTDIDSLQVKLIGENTIINKFYQESTNGSGITVDFTFTGLVDTTPPDVHITGDGSLDIIGGSIEIRTNGDLYLEAPVNFKANGDYFCDAVNGYNVTVGKNIPLTFDVNGTLIYAKNNINIKSGASIKAKTSAPFVMNDYTYKNGLLCTGDITAENANIKITLSADPERFIPHGTGIAGLLGVNNRGKVVLKNSKMEITETAGKGDYSYFFGGGGIYCGDLEMYNSALNIKVNSDDILDSYGISASGNITVEDSTLNCFEHTSGRTFGIAANGDMKVKNSTVTADVASADDGAYGIMYKTIDIDLNRYDQKVEAKVNNGFAMGANTGSGKELVGFDSEYQVTASKLGEHTVFVTPNDGVFNRASMEKSNPGSYIYLETPYSAENTETAAKYVVIGCDLPKPVPDKPGEKDKPEHKTEHKTNPGKQATEQAKKISPETGNDYSATAVLMLLISAFALTALAVLKKRGIRN